MTELAQDICSRRGVDRVGNYLQPSVEYLVLLGTQ